MKNLYYVAPEDKLFEEVKEKAIELWYEVDTDNDKYGYASGKVSQIESIGNVEDNFMYMVAMFDDGNQRLLADKLSSDARTEIRKRLIVGGTPHFYIYF